MIFCFTRGTEQSQSRPKLSLPQELPCSKADVTAVYNANTLYLDKWILFNEFTRRMFTVALSQTLVFLGSRRHIARRMRGFTFTPQSYQVNHSSPLVRQQQPSQNNGSAAPFPLIQLSFRRLRLGEPRCVRRGEMTPIARRPVFIIPQMQISGGLISNRVIECSAYLQHARVLFDNPETSAQIKGRA